MKRLNIFLTKDKMIKLRYKKHWLRAVDRLIAWYSKTEQKLPLYRCPLCEVYSRYKESKTGTHCSKICLWYLFEDHEDYACGIVVKRHSAEWNLNRVKRWRRLILESK